MDETEQDDVLADALAELDEAEDERGAVRVAERVLREAPDRVADFLADRHELDPSAAWDWKESTRKRQAREEEGRRTLAEARALADQHQAAQERQEAVNETWSELFASVPQAARYEAQIRQLFPQALEQAAAIGGGPAEATAVTSATPAT